jgi:FKBP-type peptidyl-prolyl cis-trans isomerase 2
MAVEAGSHVKLAFTATYPDGELFDTSSPATAAEHGLTDEKRHRPIVLEIGGGPTISSLEAGLIGMSEGETKRIEVPHEDLLVTYDRAAFEEMTDEPATEGAEVHASTGLLGTVVAVEDDVVTVDFDPDRSGQTLRFDVEVLSVE